MVRVMECVCEDVCVCMLSRLQVSFDNSLHSGGVCGVCEGVCVCV